jgi:hypothetical protein
VRSPCWRVRRGVAEGASGAESGVPEKARRQLQWGRSAVATARRGGGGGYKKTQRAAQGAVPGSRRAGARFCRQGPQRASCASSKGVDEQLAECTCDGCFWSGRGSRTAAGDGRLVYSRRSGARLRPRRAKAVGYGGVPSMSGERCLIGTRD